MKALSTIFRSRYLIFVALLFGVASSGWALLYYFDIGLDRVGALAAVATGGIAGTLYSLLPLNAKSWLKRYFHAIARFCSSADRRHRICASGSYTWHVVHAYCYRLEGGAAQYWLVARGVHANIQFDERSYSIWGLPDKAKSVAIGDSRRSVAGSPFIPQRIILSEGEVIRVRPSMGKSPICFGLLSISMSKIGFYQKPKRSSPPNQEGSSSV